MLNTEINELSSATSVLQASSYFDVVDSVIKTGDTNKRYIMSTNSSVAPSCPIEGLGGNFTSVIISPTADNMCDLYNSFINIRIVLELKIAKQIGANTGNNANAPLHKRAIWVGYKDSMDAIEQNQLIANVQQFYTQNNALKESYMTGSATTEAVKKSDVFSKVGHADVWNRVDTIRTGALVELPEAQTAANTVLVPVTFEIKIDIRRFLPLLNIRLLPKFAGDFQIRIKISPAALVCAPLPIEDALGFPNAISSLRANYPQVTNEFVPIGENFDMVNVISYANDL
jgi:hypothetical protein